MLAAILSCGLSKNYEASPRGCLLVLSIYSMLAERYTLTVPLPAGLDNRPSL
jgi:hypothetical protein